MPNEDTFRRWVGLAFSCVWLLVGTLPSSIAQVSVSAVSQITQTDRTATSTPQPNATVHTRRRPTIDDRVKQLAKGLDLTEEQQSAVKKILEQRQTEAMRLRLDPNISGSVRIDRYRALQDATVERIRGLLTEEQKKKYDPLSVRKIQPAPDQRSVEDWLKLTNPPASKGRK